MSTIAFELPFTLRSLNQQLRQNRWVRRSERNTLAWHVLAAIGKQRPPHPIQFARITVTRVASRRLDTDNAHASVKPLLDVLQPPSTRHPSGLSVITGDDPAHLALILRDLRGEPRTIVLIEAVIPASVIECDGALRKG